MRLHRLIALALMAQLAAAPAAAGMLVLCVGSDGHVAVESADGGLCCEEWRAALPCRTDHPEQAIEPASGPCCDDVELLIGSAALTVPVQKLVPAASIPLSTPAPAAPSSGLSAATVPFSVESPISASHRTVVLRA
jgi:hypothetical protein